MKVIGSSFIIAGTSMGAGMLALPLVSYQVGVFGSILLLCLTWLVAFICSLMIVHVNLVLGIEKNIFTSVHSILGRTYQGMTHCAFLLLFYALTAAYISSGAMLLEAHVHMLGQVYLSGEMYAIIFTFFFGFLASLGIQKIDWMSRVIFLLKISVFIYLFKLSFPFIPIDLNADLNLTLGIQNSVYLWMVPLPVFLTAFGFHGCISAIVRYLKGNKTQIIWALILGSLIPLIVYSLWLLISLGILRDAVEPWQRGEVILLLDALAKAIDEIEIKKLLIYFADFALISSFLGVSMGLLDYIEHLLSEGVRKKRYVAGIAFIPPLLCVLLFGGTFAEMLSFSALPLLFLIVLLPSMMLFRLQKCESDPNKVSD